MDSRILLCTQLYAIAGVLCSLSFSLDLRIPPRTRAENVPRDAGGRFKTLITLELVLSVSKTAD